MVGSMVGKEVLAWMEKVQPWEGSGATAGGLEGSGATARAPNEVHDAGENHTPRDASRAPGSGVQHVM